MKKIKNKLYVKCIKEIEGYTLGKYYEVLGCAGECICLKSDNGENYIVYESYFD